VVPGSESTDFIDLYSASIAPRGQAENVDLISAPNEHP
jgi:hypothetical protein